MGDADRRLHDALSEVHDFLETAEELEDADRAELRSALQDIRTALHEDSKENESSIGNGLRAAVERFEGRHPRLTEIVGRVADSLAEMGI